MNRSEVSRAIGEMLKEMKNEGVLTGPIQTIAYQAYDLIHYNVNLTAHQVATLVHLLKEELLRNDVKLIDLLPIVTQINSYANQKFGNS